jgi:phage baseplate assembly protein W
MPIIRERRRINPLDVNKNVSIGVAFPLNETNMFKSTSTIKEQSKTNLINLLLTNKGERIMQPDYGIGLQHLLFEQQIKEDHLNEIINSQINFYIPAIQLKKTEIDFKPNENTMYISIAYTFRTDGEEDAIGITL